MTFSITTLSLNGLSSNTQQNEYTLVKNLFGFFNLLFSAPMLLTSLRDKY